MTEKFDIEGLADDIKAQQILKRIYQRLCEMELGLTHGELPHGIDNDLAAAELNELTEQVRYCIKLIEGFKEPSQRPEFIVVRESEDHSYMRHGNRSHAVREANRLMKKIGGKFLVAKVKRKIGYE